jgi:hypothetical protein
MNRPIITKISYSTESETVSSIWLYRIIEKIIIDQLNQDSALVTGVLLSESLIEFEGVVNKNNDAKQNDFKESYH